MYLGCISRMYLDYPCRLHVMQDVSCISAGHLRYVPLYRIHLRYMYPNMQYGRRRLYLSSQPYRSDDTRSDPCLLPRPSAPSCADADRNPFSARVGSRASGAPPPRIVAYGRRSSTARDVETRGGRRRAAGPARVGCRARGARAATPRDAPALELNPAVCYPCRAFTSTAPRILHPKEYTQQHY